MKHLRVILTAALLFAGALFVGCTSQTPTAHTGTGEAGKAKEGAKVQHRGAAQLLFGPGENFGGHNWQVKWRVDKWRNWQDRARRRAPYEVRYVDGNILVTAGITRLENLLCGLGGQAYDSTHTRIGVGDGSTAVVIGDTDLSAAAGSTHRWFQLVDATPTVTGGNVVTFHATFAAGDGNFVWNEFGTDQGTASANTVTAPLLNRKVSSLGTKVSPGVWAITETLTIS